jgi:hypothetical protein
MPQSNVIFAFLFISFAVWVTAKGELSTYIDYLIHGAPGTSNTATAAASAETQQTASTPTGTDASSTASGVNPSLVTSYAAVAGAAALLA